MNGRTPEFKGKGKHLTHLMHDARVAHVVKVCSMVKLLCLPFVLAFVCLRVCMDVCTYVCVCVCVCVYVHVCMYDLV